MNQRKANSPAVLIAVSAVALTILVGTNIIPVNPEPSNTTDLIAVVAVYGALVFLAVPFWIRAAWNSVLPNIGPFRPVDYWQALGLLVVVSLLTLLVPS